MSLDPTTRSQHPYAHHLVGEVVRLLDQGYEMPFGDELFVEGHERAAVSLVISLLERDAHPVLAFLLSRYLRELYASFD